MASNELSKLIKNLVRRVKSAEERGYYFTKDITNPKNIKTAKKYTEDFYKYAEYRDEDTFSTVSGEEGRRIERQKAYYKGLETRKKKEFLKEQEYIKEYNYIPINDGVISELQGILSSMCYASFSEYIGSPTLKEYKADTSSKLLWLLEQNIGQDEESYREYVEYLEGHNEEIKAALEMIIRTSNRDDVAVNASSVAFYINYQRALDADTAEEIGYQLEQL